MVVFIFRLVTVTVIQYRTRPRDVGYLTRADLALLLLHFATCL